MKLTYTCSLFFLMKRDKVLMFWGENMKLIINYDLLDQIRMSNTGISLQRIKMKMGLYLGAIGFTNLMVLMMHGNIPSNLNLPSAVLIGTWFYVVPEIITSKWNKALANNRLDNLSSRLQNINIYTDSEKIKNAKLYKTNYKVRLENKKPIITQNKYFMLPTTGYLNSDEVSLLQEHDMFAREYALSIGEPKRKEQKVLSKVFAKQNF